jgi:hypothetical protein
VVSRRLRAAGFTISPAARRYVAQGVFVRAHENRVSVTVDLGVDSVDVAAEIAAEIASWGFLSMVTKDEHEGETWATVRFTYEA